MKKSLVTLVLSVLIVVGSLSSAVAADEGGVHLSIGYKAWMNTWETSFFSDDNTFSGKNVMSFTSDQEMTSIPVIGIRFRDVFFSGSYYTKTDFTFPTQTFMADDGLGAASLVTQKTAAERKEFDGQLGYYLSPNVAISVGYKNISQKYTTSYSDTGSIITGTFTTTDETKIKGPTVGVSASSSIGGGFGVYGNFAYGWLKAEMDTDKFDAEYVLSEIGFNHKAANLPLVLTVGYRQQIITTEIDNFTNKVPDVTRGLVVGASLIF